MSLSLVIIPTTVVGAGVLVAAVTDLWKFKVHNLLTLPMLLAGLLYHACIGEWHGLAASLLGAAFGFVVLFIFYAMGGMGGGDVKLMAAVGAWLGLPLVFYLFLISALVTGLYAVGLIIVHGQFRQTWVNLQILWYRLTAVARHLGGDGRIEAEVQNPERRKNVIPFATMMAIGLFGMLLWYFLRQGE